MKLSERAMLARLSIGAWGSRKHDDAVTQEVTDNHKAEQGAGSYTKVLVSRKLLAPITKAMTAASSTHRAMTLPWDDNGERILAVTGYQQYAQQMRLARLTCQARVQEALEGYPKVHMAEARTRLGTMFNKDDYPPLEEVTSRFYIDVEIRPIPESGDFRAKIGDKEAAIIAKDIERRSKERLDKAMSAVFLRIADVASKMVERLTVYQPALGIRPSENNFRETLVSNIKELADILPVLNLADDPRLVKLQTQLVKDLCAYSPEELRASDAVRSKTAKKAQAILDKVNEYLA